MRSEVVLISRSLERGSLVVTCTPSFFVDVPLTATAPAPLPRPTSTDRRSVEDEIVSFVRQFHRDASGPAEGLRRYYADHVLLDGRWRSRDEVMDVRREVARLDPYLQLDDGSVRVVSLGPDRWEVTYTNTSWITRNGQRRSTRWAVRAVIERHGSALTFVEIMPRAL